MKLLHVFITLGLILGITSGLYSASEFSQPIRSLSSLATSYISTHIKTIVKDGMHKRAPINTILEQTHPWLKDLTQDAIYMIRTELLKLYATKTFRVLRQGTLAKEQLFDGRIIDQKDDLDPHEHRNDPYCLKSTWYSLNIDQLIEKYYIVHQAWEAKACHPFEPTPSYAYFLDNDDEEPLFLSRGLNQ